MCCCRINNAGTNAYTYQPLSSNTDEELQQIVTTNVLGTLLCCREVGAGRQIRRAVAVARIFGAVLVQCGCFRCCCWCSL